MINLLEKIRRINRLIQKAEGYPVSFEDMAHMLAELIGANTYVANSRGRVLGAGLLRDFECEIMVDRVLRAGQFPPDYNTRLLEKDEPLSNLTQEKRRCVFQREEPCKYEHKVTTIIPINGGGERLGTLVLARYVGRFGEDDQVLAEYAATVVGLELLRVRGAEREEQARRKAAVQVALSTLSYSELEAVQHIFDELRGEEGLLVASKIADRVGITRSVIVNALRKFESAGVIESRSLGMKGTHIKVLNDCLLPELARWRR